MFCIKSLTSSSSSWFSRKQSRSWYYWVEVEHKSRNHSIISWDPDLGNCVKILLCDCDYDQVCIEQLQQTVLWLMRGLYTHHTLHPHITSASVMCLCMQLVAWSQDFYLTFILHSTFPGVDAQPFSFYWPTTKHWYCNNNNNNNNCSSRFQRRRTEETMQMIGNHFNHNN